MMMHRFLPFVFMISMLSGAIELEMAAPCFPDMVKSLCTTPHLLGQTLSINLFAFCIASLFYGPLCERFGNRLVMIVGNAILALGAFCCALSSSIEMLLFFRFIQGVGAATSAVIVTIMIAQMYRQNEALKLYGMMNAFFTTLMALAPIFGAIINEAWGWRANYFTVAMVCFFSLLVIIFFLPNTQKTESKSFKSTLVAFKKLLSSSLFWSASLVPSLFYAFHLSFVGMAPFLYRSIFELDNFWYSIHQAIMIASFAVVSLFAGYLPKFIKIKNLVIFATLFYLLFGILMVTAKTPWWVTLFVSGIGVSAAILYPIIFARSMEIFPDDKGVASSLIMTIRYLLCAFITMFCAILFQQTILSLTGFCFAIMLINVALIVGLYGRKFFSK